MGKLLKEPEGRERLGHIRRNTWYQLIREGKLRAVRIGRAIRVSEEEIDRFIRDAEREAQGGVPDGAPVEA